ncbi:purine-nucleoside phosphorylase [Gordonia phosphorivorans]|uniref:Purine nucleoside phosphorylase n=1 Tax=Gordonia phosphorivorans TaxID=1056982 RepID=A0ABV6HA31_9ACTN
MDPTLDADAAAVAAAAYIAAHTDCRRHDVAVVLGSGWAPAADEFGLPLAELPMTLIPGFTVPSAQGHSGSVRSVRIGSSRVLIMAGRVHAYEGHHLSRVVHPIRTAAAAGVRTVILTNAAGGIADGLDVGQPVLIADQLNLTGRSPLHGAQFVNMVDAYSPALRTLARDVDPSLREGVYAGLPGPQYETPAEITMLKTIGADLVGMSTVHETIAARAAGLDVLGVSLVTNLAAGITGEPLAHSEVLEVGRASATRMGTLLAEVVTALDRR